MLLLVPARRNSMELTAWATLGFLMSVGELRTDIVCGCIAQPLEWDSTPPAYPRAGPSTDRHRTVDGSPSISGVTHSSRGTVVHIGITVIKANNVVIWVPYFCVAG